MKILMVAAENGAILGGKVGGIGDVVRDIPLALAELGHHVDVVVPSYGAFSKQIGAQHITSLEIQFAGTWQKIDVFKIKGITTSKRVTQWVIEHPLLAVGGVGKIYCDDPDDRPFATDATKFALFSAAVAKTIISQVFGDLDVLHLHDWHTAMVLVLRAFDPEYHQLKLIKTVYTIHNLALQGIRPISDDGSSLRTWFPNLLFEQDKMNDPRYYNCFNPMRAGINLADKVHAVSPQYAEEILLPSNTVHGFFGGEGLENDLCAAINSGRLHGILNGCEYSEKTTRRLDFKNLLQCSECELIKWLANKPLVDSAHLIAMTRIKQLLACQYKFPPMVLTSVGRITTQKVAIFQQITSNNVTALEQLLLILGERGIFVLLGSGDKQLEYFFTKIAAENANFLFLKGYSESLSEHIYASGDLFIMPSSFEPCGISQMLAMRAGQPCLVHSVGGLKNTIINNKNGFTFSGDTPAQQAENMLSCFKLALNKKWQKPKEWLSIANNALNTRFLWRDAAQDYIKYLYTD